MQQVDTDPPSLPVGTEVSAKYKGAFCEAKVSKVVRNIKVKIAYKQGLGSGIVSDDLIKIGAGQLRVGAAVEVRHPDRKDFVEGTVTKIQDCSQYTVVFDDGDITTLRRTALCLKSGRHFNESETLDQLPLTHPEHFGNPVVGGRRGRRRGHLNDDSSDDEDESDTKEIVNEKEEHIGKVVCVEMETKKKDKEKWFPGLILAPAAQANVRIRVKDEYLVRSFKDGRYYTVPKKETTEFTREAASKQDGQAVQAALEYLDSGVLPPHWDRESLFGLNNSSSEGDGELESDSSDDEPREEKDRFVAQLYKYMDDRGTPLNKVPSIQNRDVDLYRLFRAVQKCGGYNRVTAKNQWKSIAIRLGFTPVTVSVTNLVKQAFKKFLQPYGEFHRKLGCSMLMTPRNSNRSKGRSLVRANSVASPKPVEVNKDSATKSTTAPASISATPTVVVTTTTNIIATTPSTLSLPSVSSCQNITASPVLPTATVVAINNPTTPSVAEESENTSETSIDNAKNKRTVLVGKVKGLVENYEEKSKDDGDVPLSKMKQIAADLLRSEDKEKETKDSKEISPSIGSHVRESSPPGTSAGNKKDKNQQRKQTPQSDDKRNKRKKDDTIEKVDAGDFVVEVGDKLKVYYHEKKVTYEAKVIEISVQRGSPMYLVHYTGWNNRYDEWVPRERIAENITKGSKQKSRISNLGSAEKQKENPSKPPSSSLNASGPSNSMINVLGSTPNSSKSSATAKRGRGRSDSLPPRSTTPSSVASNSSRTKSPATAGTKRRPVRSMVSSTRRTSANVSDVSLQSESETDSDEPVRRPTRGTKEVGYKTGSLSSKATSKNKVSVSAGNSQSDSDGDDEDGDTSTISRAKSRSTNSMNSKGRNYDLSQIRSELRGFQGLKSPSPSLEGNVDIVKRDIKAETSIKNENIFDAKESSTDDNKQMAETSTVAVAVKVDLKADIKDENVKSSTDMSSETESFCDDDSQSSGKTTTLENMTKKFQQKIKAGKQQALEKLTSGKSTVERVPREVEKIIQDSLAEKLQESLKTKPDVKPEEGLEISPTDTVICKSFNDKKEESKKNSTKSVETLPKAFSNSQTRFGNNTNSSKFSSVIVEKPTTSAKKTDSIVNKKNDITKKASTGNFESHSKVVIKEISKTEPPAACSPSSSSSSSSSSTSVSSRSLPDMSKLDISGGSSSILSSSSSYTISNKEAKILSATSKPTSPDIYEFKDPEPFEFEMRKMPTSATNSSLSSIAISESTATLSSPRKQNQKIGSQTVASEKPQHNPSPIAALVNRKKRGSPLKEATLDKTKIIKTDEKSSIVSDGKLIPINSTTSTAAKSSLANQTKLLNLNTASSNQTQSSSISAASKGSDVSKYTPFDTLRKSPNYNVNINALNEELAQTVQETTRALTDAFQSPTASTPPDVTNTSPKLEPQKNEKDIESLITPPRKNVQAIASTSTTCASTTTPKKVIGSPFVETRKDLSNVFELSTSEGSASTSELKDNKFEFENAKKMLSATVGAFDLDPSKFENKPTSIADKLLKAISQKKEEDKQKVEPKNDKPDKIDESTKAATVVAAVATNSSDCLSQLGNIPNEPLNINTDLVGSSFSYLSSGNNLSMDKLPIISSSLNKPTPLTSPEPKLGILESIAIKNNDLTETIQKLECAIQRRTPVAGLSVATTPTSSLAPNTFSEDSMDSTDSERRLVIEDVAEDICDMLKSPSTGSQQIGELKALSKGAISQKMENVITKVSHSVAVQNPIPVKVLQPSRSHTTTTTVSVPNTITSTINTSSTNKMPENTNLLNIAPQTKPGQQEVRTFNKRDAPNELKQKLDADHKTTNPERNATTELCYDAAMGSKDKINAKLIDTSEVPTTSNTNAMTSSISTKISKQQIQNSGNVVPIVVPDIPVSVVVASGAVPSVKAAAQAAAAAAISKNQSHIFKPTTQADLKFGVTTATTTTSSIPLPSSSPIVSCRKTTFSAPIGKNVTENINPATTSNTRLSVNDMIVNSSSEVPSLPPVHVSSNSGFYLVARTELRPEDGVKPILENQQLLSHEGEDFEVKRNIVGEGGEPGGQVDMCTEELSSNLCADANSESINLLCEETIPGSPAPIFGGKEESLSASLTTELIKESDRKEYVNNPNIPRTGVSSTNINSSPNDSASQDESSEDIKKTLDIENEISPRKRRRTRKQSEMIIISEHSSKRRKQISSSKKIPAGSDSDENSDGVSQRSNVSSRQQFHQQYQQNQQPQTSAGTRPCPYNFLVQLDPSMGSEQSIAIIMKQIQELRKTYNTIKADLASIDRRRKKLRRREREKKQLVQNQQQIKIA
ncbi:AT-rich interactive domain-containing protein 4B [Eurosta solidaginis]|uniref:AT-rich interactive domain-containing protein 4B n=1 Tax=Eurosta solidaginis TaxID=178769 RepID=UPI0035317866